MIYLLQKCGDIMSVIKLIKFTDEIDNYKLMYEWCRKDFIYEWFEQRVLTFDEIINKYKNKLINKKQDLFFINYNKKNIGYVQIYKYEDKIFDELNRFNNIYEFDIFIGEEEYLSKGIGTKIVNYVNKYTYLNYLADCIILRPFKKNKRAIKCYQKNGFHIISEYDDISTIGKKEKIVVMINNKNKSNN